MDKKTQQKTNPVLQDTIRVCEEAARTHDAAVWAAVADELKKANRVHREINLSSIERYAEDGETIVVPGKVLGAGRLTKDVTVAAFAFTQSALESVEDTGTAVYIDQLVEENPDGTDVRLFK